MESRTIQHSIHIHAAPEQIWAVLTEPEFIRLYLGSEVRTDWKVGSPITWAGEMQGVKFVNKGKVLEYRPYEWLSFTYWSGMGGDADAPENYSTVTYMLASAGDGEIVLTYVRKDIPTDMEKMIFEGHLPHMLGEIKGLAEG